MSEKLKSAGTIAVGLFVALALLAVAAAILFGAATFSTWALEWIPNAIGLATLVGVALIPLAVIPPTRGFAGFLFGLISFVYIACLWLYAPLTSDLV